MNSHCLEKGVQMEVKWVIMDSLLWKNGVLARINVLKDSKTSPKINTGNRACTKRNTYLFLILYYMIMYIYSTNITSNKSGEMVLIIIMITDDQQRNIINWSWFVTIKCHHLDHDLAWPGIMIDHDVMVSQNGCKFAFSWTHVMKIYM